MLKQIKELIIKYTKNFLIKIFKLNKHEKIHTNVHLQIIKLIRVKKNYNYLTPMLIYKRSYKLNIQDQKT